MLTGILTKMAKEKSNWPKLGLLYLQEYAPGAILAIIINQKGSMATLSWHSLVNIMDVLEKKMAAKRPTGASRTKA